MEKQYISAKDVVNKYGLSYSSLNYYTNLGLFEVKKRNRNVRFYDEEEVSKAKSEINKLIDQGYPLGIIRKMMQAV